MAANAPPSTPIPAWLKGRLQPEPAYSRAIYNTFFKFSPTYMTTIMITATFAGLGFDAFMNGLWDFNNKGVSPRAATRRAAAAVAAGGVVRGVRAAAWALPPHCSDSPTLMPSVPASSSPRRSSGRTSSTSTLRPRRVACRAGGASVFCRRAGRRRLNIDAAALGWSRAGGVNATCSGLAFFGPAAGLHSARLDATVCLAPAPLVEGR